MVIGSSDTTSGRWHEIDRLFHEALELGSSERDGFLSRSCAEDAALRIEVERLIHLHESNDTFLETNRQVLGAETFDATRMEGRTVGGFKLVRQIGEGGMATVWHATRDNAAFEQRVALKVMRWGPVTSNWRGRFASERQALAQLEHPYITRLIDGGTADVLGDAFDGLPYLVMEYVEGIPLSRYCDAHRLPVNDRLRLFCRVCEAVHYAHQNLIVHRDLKPGNILVAEDGNPKLLDFGIAKLLASDSPATDAATETLLRALTPRYASPEQVRGEAITTASDIYSLGVMLYELLTGRRAYPDPGSSRYERERMVCEVEPTCPSMVVDSDSAVACSLEGTDTVPTSAELAAARGEIRPILLRRELQGDLDNIILKALQKEPLRRYSTVQQFREDIDRYLAGMPVIARKDTASYRITKFVRRNKSAVVGAIAVVAALACGVTGTLMGLREARSERDVANRVSTFIQQVLVSANPYHHGGETNVLDVLRDASRRVTRELRDQPEAGAAARYAIAEVYGGLWKWSEAEPQARMALDTYRELHGDRHPAVANCLSLLGRALTFRGCKESIGIQREALAIRTHLYGSDHPLTAESKACLAFAYWAASDEPRWFAAEKLYREAIHSFRSTNMTNHRIYARALFSLGAMYLSKGNAGSETEALLGESLSVFRNFTEDADRYLSECLRTLASLHRAHGRIQEEAFALEESLTMTPEIFLSDDSVRRSAWRRAELAIEMQDVADYQRCLQRAMQAECGRREEFPKIHGASWSEFANDLPRFQSNYELVTGIGHLLDNLPMEPCPWNLELTELLSEHVPFVSTYVDPDNGHIIARKCLDYQITRFPYRQREIAVVRVKYGKLLMAYGKLDEAEEQLQTAYKTLHPQLANSDPKHVDVVRALIRLYEARREPEEVRKYRSKLPVAVLEYE